MIVWKEAIILTTNSREFGATRAIYHAENRPHKSTNKIAIHKE